MSEFFSGLFLGMAAMLAIIVLIDLDQKWRLQGAKDHAGGVIACELVSGNREGAVYWECELPEDE